MPDPVELALALCNAAPTSMGSDSPAGQYNIVVQNLADQKQVSIWTQVGAEWQAIDARYIQALPENRELWIAPAGNSAGEFAARYTVDGRTFWDNNGGRNYQFPPAGDEFAVLAGNNYKVVLGTTHWAAGEIEVEIGVQNLAYRKVVGIVCTPDNWSTVHIAHASYSGTMPSGLEVWRGVVPVGAAAAVRLAVFYRVLGREYWDDNFWRAYLVTPIRPRSWGAPP